MTGLPFVYANAAYKTLLCGQTRIIQALILWLTAGAPAPGLCRILPVPAGARLRRGRRPARRRAVRGCDLPLAPRLWPPVKGRGPPAGTSRKAVRACAGSAPEGVADNPAKPGWRIPFPRPAARPPVHRVAVWPSTGRQDACGLRLPVAPVPLSGRGSPAGASSETGQAGTQAGGRCHLAQSGSGFRSQRTALEVVGFPPQWIPAFLPWLPAGRFGCAVTRG